MKTISIVVPCYNEEATIDKYHNAVKSLWEGSRISDRYELELIFINDGSSDNTRSMIEQLSKGDPCVHYTSFSRNFGKEAAIFCGLKQATGDAVVVMDADLQHPPAVIEKMIEKWESGKAIIEGVKSDRGRERHSHRFMSRLFYSLMCRMTGFDMADSSDFKLMDRKVVDVLNSLSEKATFFRALTYWVGFDSDKVEFEVAERSGGTGKWTGRSLFSYAISNMTSFTYAPLYIIGLTGIVILLVGLYLGVDAIITYFEGIAVSGYPSLVILITLCTGGIMLSLGVIAIYIAKMYTELKNRPRYIIEDQK